MLLQRSFLFVGIFICSSVLISQNDATPLDDYVNTPDPHYAWSVIKTYEQPDYTLYILNFTSQKWLDGSLNQERY